jgi:hypothetical protein
MSQSGEASSRPFKFCFMRSAPAEASLGRGQAGGTAVSRYFLLDVVLFRFQDVGMNWEEAIERHRESLLRIVAALFAMVGLGQGGMVERLSWPLHRAVLRVLRPAESAVRRLIVVAARDLVVKPPQARSAPAGLNLSGNGQGRVSFQLFDPRKRFNRRRYAGSRPEPRIHVMDGAFDPRVPLFRLPQPAAPAPAPEPDDTVRAAPLCRRLAAIKGALEDLASQARRYARWRARPFAARRPKLASTLRPGAPPGFRKTPTHEVDAILTECDWLARHVPQPDTS